MAFPTSPSNNQIHSEGGRSFVYDSSLAVWDQLNISDSFLGQHQGTGQISSNVKFPSGHVVQVRPVKWGVNAGTDTTTSEYYVATATADTITFTEGNRVMAIGSFYLNAYGGGTDTAGECQFSTNAHSTGVIGGTTEKQGQTRYRSYITSSAQQAENGFMMAMAQPPGTSCTITLGIYAASGGTCAYGWNVSWMQLWEIQT